MKIFRWLNPFNWGGGFHAQVDTDGNWTCSTGKETKAGVTITPANALKVPVVWTCTKVISDMVSTMPLRVYEKKGGIKVVSDSTDHEVRRIKRPHQYLSMSNFLKFAATQICLKGNACGMIARNKFGEPISITAVDWDAVTVVVSDNGSLSYEVSTEAGNIPVSYENMIHIKIFTLDGIIGLSPVMWLQETMGLSAVARDWAASFMRNGGWSGGYLIYDQFLTAEQRGQIRSDIPDIRRDGMGSIGKVGLIQGGPKMHSVGISPKDSQFIEARQFTDEEIASAYGVPMWIINRMRSNSYVGSGLEQQIIQFLIFGLDVYLKAIEDEINDKIFDYSKKGRSCEFVRQAVMQMDSKARAEFYKAALGGSGGSGWLSVNRVRELENEPPLDEEKYNEVTVWFMEKSNGDQNADE